jgi:DNA-binding Xre family transcriptional regulator
MGSSFLFSRQENSIHEIAELTRKVVLMGDRKHICLRPEIGTSSLPEMLPCEVLDCQPGDLPALEKSPASPSSEEEEELAEL